MISHTFIIISRKFSSAKISRYTVYHSPSSCAAYNLTRLSHKDFILATSIHQCADDPYCSAGQWVKVMVILDFVAAWWGHQYFTNTSCHIQVQRL